MRFIAFGPKQGVVAKSWWEPRLTRDSRKCFVPGRPLGLLLSIALSFRLARLIVAIGNKRSSKSVLQFYIDGEILVDETDGTVKRMCRFFCCHTLLPTMSHTIVLAEISINGFQTVVRFLSILMWLFALHETLTADEPAMIKTLFQQLIHEQLRNAYRNSLLIVP